jgi:hypothetical protein
MNIMPSISILSAGGAVEGWAKPESGGKQK